MESVAHTSNDVRELDGYVVGVLFPFDALYLHEFGDLLDV